MTGQELRDLRLSSGLSMTKLAEMVGVSRQTIHNWQTGKHKINGRDAAYIESVIKKAPPQ